MPIDWLTIKTEYINSDISQRKLAEKYGISFNTLKKKANKELWAKAREKQRESVTTKVQQKICTQTVNQTVNNMKKLSELTSELLKQVERATRELDSDVVVNKHKTRTIEYKDKNAKGKPTKEIIDETEEKVIVSTLIDRQGLLQVTASLKNIKDVLSFTGEGTDEEDSDAYFDEAGMNDE